MLVLQAGCTFGLAGVHVMYVKVKMWLHSVSGWSLLSKSDSQVVYWDIADNCLGVECMRHGALWSWGSDGYSANTVSCLGHASKRGQGKKSVKYPSGCPVGLVSNTPGANNKLHRCMLCVLCYMTA